MLHDNNITIGVDVDGTTLDSSSAWWEWLWHMCGGHTNGLPKTLDQYHKSLKKSMFGKRPKLNYDLSAYFGDPINSNIDKFEFWRHTGVYDTVKPIKGAVENIKKLMLYGDIVFITHNKGNGGRSKFMNLDRLFGRDNFYYMVTKEKHMVNVDYLIDDRLEFLEPCSKVGIECMHLNSIFEQKESLTEFTGFQTYKNWDEIFKRIKRRSVLEDNF